MSSRYNHYKSDKPLTGKARKVRDLMMKSDNRICADCGAPDPKWASANIGVFLCLKCSDVHRSLGADISKVLSVTLDEWSDEDINSMVGVGGNSYANSMYEAFLPRGHPRAKADSDIEERTKFIRAKYETQEFLQPSLPIVSSKMSFRACESVKSTDSSLMNPVSSLKIPDSSTIASTDSSLKNPVNSLKIPDSSTIASTSKKHVYEDKREFIGGLIVKVVKGSHLAVRDMLSSDPYVVLNLGNQKVQTTIKKRNLNPVWNEVLELSIPQKYGPLKLQVYDHDVFSADDIMGEAEVDLQPMITAAIAFGDPSLLGNMQIGRWFKTSDNALIKDSTVNVVDGKVKQEIFLKLQNVECGELELELEWVPLPLDQ